MIQTIEDILLHAPIVSKIVKHLNYISILSFCRAYPSVRNKIAKKYIDFRQVFARSLVKLIRSKGDSFEKIKNAPQIVEEILREMEETQTYVSGSFLLYCLVGDSEISQMESSVGDVDFFTNNYYKEYRSKRLKDNYGRAYKQIYVSKFSNKLYHSSIDIFDTESFLCQHRGADPGPIVKHRHIYVESEFGETLPDRLLHIRDFFINNLKIQDIVIRDKFNVSEFVNETFDCDFLKNTFDGRTLKIRNPQSVIKKKCTVNMFHAYFKGFLIVHGYESDGIQERFDFIRRQLERLYKYTKRGFQIEKDWTKNLIKVKKLCMKIYPIFNDDEIERESRNWDYFVENLDRYLQREDDSPVFLPENDFYNFPAEDC